MGLKYIYLIKERFIQSGGGIARLVGTISIAVTMLLLLGVPTLVTVAFGGTQTYLPLIQGVGTPSPAGNLILYEEEGITTTTLFVSSPPPAQVRTQLAQVVSRQGVAHATFSPDSRYVSYERRDSDEVRHFFYLAETDGSSDVPLFTTEQGSFRAPTWSADSRMVAYRVGAHSGYGTDDLYSVSIDTRTPITLATNAIGGPAWYPNAARLYYAAVNANGTTDDLRSVNGDGTDNRLVAEVNGKTFVYQVVSDGRLLFRIYENGSDDLYLITPDGAAITRLTTTPRFEEWVSLTPGGDTILFAVRNVITLIDLSGTELWSFDCGGDCGLARLPVSWTGDGREVAFTVLRTVGGSAYYDVYTAPTDGSQSTPTLVLADRAFAHGFSIDGRYFAYEEDLVPGRDSIQVVDRETGTTTTLTSATAYVYFSDWGFLP